MITYKAKVVISARKVAEIYIFSANSYNEAYEKLNKYLSDNMIEKTYIIKEIVTIKGNLI